jgi:hypothetical protein
MNRVYTLRQFSCQMIYVAVDVVSTCLVWLLIDWLIISIGWDVSAPRPTTGLLFIPQLICKRGETLWDDNAGWGKLLTRPPEFSGSATSRVIWEQVGGIDEWVGIFHISIWDTSANFNVPVKSYNMVPPPLFPIRRKACCRFLSSLKIQRLGRDPWVQWQAH